ncbi:MAG TPA: ATP-dependent DNA ligase [Vicinamibacteria bacterium]|jgi:ATP-dependent DNA ligase|nr:ATP-dependent DNA ligase [Vicinamibacteria bacterium]
MAGKASGFPIDPPIEPMLAKLATELPSGDGWLFEPKWDGFRAIVYRDHGRVYIQSRDLRPLDRYFPELDEVFLSGLPERCVVDGEIVIVGEHGLDFDRLQLRLHPAESRVRKLAAATPADFVAFDLLADGDVDIRARPQAERRGRLEHALAGASGRVHLTPCSRERSVAGEWFQRFEGAGLDGVMAKHEATTYQPGKRVMVKVKHARTADCAVAGFRWHKQGPGTHVGSLLLGLYDGSGTLQHVGVTSSFAMETRRRLAQELEPLRKDAMASHPWREWAALADGTTRMPGMQSRWSAGKDLAWEPVRVERVCEVKYDHLQGDRFRHAAIFLRWRPDKRPADCRYDQLEVTPPAELAEVFGRS